MPRHTASKFANCAPKTIGQGTNGLDQHVADDLPPITVVQYSGAALAKPLKPLLAAHK